MTAKEGLWAFQNKVMVSLEIDPIKKLTTWYECITEIGYAYDKEGEIYVFATCKDRIANSVTTTKISEIKFAKKEDEERCHRELDIQKEQVS